MNHYTYEIFDKSNNKRYIGKRSSISKPEEDLGHKYFSSSSDLLFIKKQKTNPELFEYKILGQFDSSKEALENEIYLHNLHDVAKNPNFYNKAKQTSTGFDKTGNVTHTKGKVTCIDKVTGERKSVQKEIFDSSDNLVGITYGLNHINGRFKNMVSCKDITTGEFFSVTKEEFNESPNLKGINYRKNKSDEQKEKISSTLKGRKFSEAHLQNLKKANKNKDFKKIYTPEIRAMLREARSKTKILIGLEVLYNKSKNYFVFNETGNLMFIITCRFKFICEYNNLPFNALKKSAEEHGTPLYSKCEPAYSKYNQYKGWYCLEEADFKY